MTTDMLLERYRSHLELKNFSARTIVTQFAALKVLLRFLAETNQPDIAACTTETLRAFQRWHFYQPTHRGTARGIAYQNRVLSSVKSLFRFLHEETLIARDPAAALEHAREPQTLPRNILTPQEARRIIEAPDIGTPLGYRDRAILETLYATGIRKNELMNLTVADVNLDEELLRINGGKGAKDRVVPLTQAAARFLESYIKANRPKLLGKGTSPRLFLSLRGLPIARNTLGELVTKHA